MSSDNSPIILSINTAVLPLEVVIYRSGRLLSAHDEESADSFASHMLLSAVDEACRAAEVKLSDINLFAVASGPGSFTGLRTGIAVVKGLAQTLRRPCVGVSTLHAVAYHEFQNWTSSSSSSSGAARHIIAVLPAGRGEVYAQGVIAHFTNHNNVIHEVTTAPLHLTPQALLARMESLSELHWCGEGAHLMSAQIAEAAERGGKRFKAAITNTAADEATETGAAHAGIDETEFDNTESGLVWTLGAATSGGIARSVARLAEEALKQHRTIRAAELQACYVRLSDAELNEICLKQNSTGT